MIKTTFLGTNGSCAYNNGKRKLFGTNTLCTLVEAGGASLLFDAGTGLCGCPKLTGPISLFLSHYHMDHLNGLLFWKAVFDPENDITIYGPGDIGGALELVLSHPLSPVKLADLPARPRLVSVCGGDTIVLTSISVKTISLNHPGGCMGYRVEHEGGAICYMTDVEFDAYADTGALVDFARGAKLLIADTGFADGRNKPGWGHSTPSGFAALAQAAGVGRLALYHYQHTAGDDEIKALEECARRRFPAAFASYDGLELTL